MDKPKTAKKKTVIHRLDKIFSKLVRTQDRCELSGLDNIRCNGNLQCMHIIGRANRNLRWDRNNAICGCAGHHIYYTHHPFEFFEIVKKEFPEKYHYVDKKRMNIKRWTLQDLLDLEKSFTLDLSEDKGIIVWDKTDEES